MEPKISVIIPTCNRPELLKKAIASVERQTYRNVELIVIDDGETRLGGGAARNKGIRQATGDYIAFLDDDDQWMPDKLEVQLGLFEKTPPEVGFSFTAVTKVYDDRAETTTVSNGIADYHTRVLENFKEFLNVTLMFKREVFDVVGGYDEAFPNHQEIDLLIRVSRTYQGLGINIPLTRVNMSREYVRTNKATPGMKIQGREMLLKKHHTDFASDPINLAWQFFQLGILYRNNGQYDEARKFFQKAWKLDKKIRYKLHEYWLFHHEKKQPIRQEDINKVWSSMWNEEKNHIVKSVFEQRVFSDGYPIQKKYIPGGDEHSILDIGSGSGRYGVKIAQDFPKCRILITDIIPESLAVARALAEQLHITNAEFQTEDAMALSFRDNTFDVVFCNATLQYVLDFRKAVVEMARVAKPGGRVILSTVNANNPLYHLYRLIQGNAYPYRYERPFSHRELKKLLGESGLDILAEDGYSVSHTVYRFKSFGRIFKLLSQITNRSIKFIDRFTKRFLSRTFGFEIVVIAQKP